ncbi:LysE family transporter [Enterovibrio nigricans]|uniref:Threonine/homoserine/homoserine lactone efflux protein n=1 Tax=Enterovibrio nigricans DSM 22720 TaxID=1121868 RepID=A0A1T4V4W7_9GAMM|nr:LysE family transporter [Enterovibrio nigricans]PKF50485.1 lysine transporter LysE [Enterovibrio nigricans]SKA59953.1 Threonine/homoserine/homoserine lactone efflux protein [Enterovibrio nigricans DSM 22720]
MDIFLAIANVALIWILAAITPGANVLLTINTALNYNRHLATFSALGVAFAVALWALFGGSGLIILFSLFPEILTGMKLIGGAYLIYLGLRQLKQIRMKRTLTLSDQEIALYPSPKKVLLTAFFTSILNVKTGFFVVSVFSVSVTQDITLPLIIAIMCTMSGITMVWHLFLSYAFSRHSAKSTYEKASRMLDFITGGLFTLFGIKVMVS